MDRKEMIKKLGEHFGVTPRYLKAPSFGYEIATADDVYTIAKDGQITASTGAVVTYEGITQTMQTEGASNAEDTIVDEFEIAFPLEGHTGTSLLNILNMLTSKQNLLMQALKLNTKLVDEAFSTAMNTRKIGGLEDFIEAFQSAGPDRCQGMKLELEDGNFALRIKGDAIGEEKIQAFVDLAVFINKNAKELKKSSPKPAQDENPKYALRTWLIRLGMNGEPFKTARKVLLANLEGSSAFRTVE